MKSTLLTLAALMTFGAIAQEPKAIPSEEIGVKQNPTAIHIQRTMKALEESTAEKPAYVKVLFYGQSIVGQHWHPYIIKGLQKKYPTAIFEVANKAIGGYQAENLIRTAESDLYPYYPDILFFHVYGNMEKYEEIIKKVRATTSAEIVLWTSHLNAKENPKELLESPDKRSVAIKEVAERNNCMFIDLRTKWCEMLLANNWESKEMLGDSVHMKNEKTGCMAKTYYAHFIGEELCRIKGANGEADVSGKIEVVSLKDKRIKRRSDGSLELSFEGNRVVAVSDGKGKEKIDIKLDAKNPSEFAEMYYNTRPSTLVSWMPMIRCIERKEGVMPVKEDWTLTYIEGTEPFGPLVYKVEGSVTGLDGEGRSDADFESKSGRAVIKKADFQAIWQYSYFVKSKIKKGDPLKGKYAKVGETIKWKTLPLFAEDWIPGKVDERTTLIQNCSNGKHKLTLKSKGSVKGIKEFIVYSPAKK
jgi:hypothetical protein